MSLLSKRRFGFATAPLYRRREPHAFQYLSEQVTFWIAVVSVLAFVAGNMMGQYGWHVFWKSVLGEGNDSLIEFTGTVSPFKEGLPDYKAWAKLGGDVRLHTFDQVPKDLLRPLPAYVQGTSEGVYLVDQLATYDTGRGQGSHPGIDISAPIGTPLQSIANGIVTRVSFDAGGYGNYIVIKHPMPDPKNPEKKTAVYSVYGHLSDTFVRENDIVRKGDLIGKTGMTGFATGPHLHFQVDLASAPWHPYWPFTGTEAREAGFNFVQAVDAGLHRERGLEFTANPMLFVQQYISGVTVVKNTSSSTAASTTAKRPLTVAERRQQRVDRLKATGDQVAAVTTLPVTVNPAPAVALSTNPSVLVTDTTVASENPALVLPAPPRDVTALSFRMDRSFSSMREKKKVTITLLDDNGQTVTSPVLTRPLVLRTAFGQAEFSKNPLTAADFVSGVATIEMLPIGQQTVQILVQPMGVMSQPMKFERK